MPGELSADTRRKLAGVLGMLGSNHAGERDAAAQLANRMIRGAGLTWSELIAVSELGPNPHRDPPPYRPPPGPASWRGLAWQCAAYPEWLSAWEREFLAGLPHRSRLSAKQAAILDRIAGQLRRRGGDV
jgi:hypothetical protein